MTENQANAFETADVAAEAVSSKTNWKQIATYAAAGVAAAAVGFVAYRFLTARQAEAVVMTVAETVTESLR